MGAFDVLNKSIMETNKQGREDKMPKHGVREHHVTHGNLGMIMVEKPLPVYDGKIAQAHCCLLSTMSEWNK